MFGSSCLSNLAKRHNMRIAAVGPEPFLEKSVHGKNPAIQCDYCLQAKPTKEVKTVQIIKWKDESSHGIRNICKDCRVYLRGQFVLIEAPAKLASSVSPVSGSNESKKLSPLVVEGNCQTAGMNQPAQGVDQGHVLTKVGSRRGKGGPGTLHFRSNLHGPARVSAIGKLWVLHSSSKRFTVCTNGGEIIQRDTLEEALGVLVESVLEGGGGRR